MEQKQGILDKSMLLVLRMGWLPSTKTISTKVLTTSADPRMISNVKKLFKSDELNKIANARASLVNYLKSVATPFPSRAGSYLIAVDLVGQAENKLVQHLEFEEKLVDAFISVYDQTLQNSEQLLGDQFNRSDYDSKERVKDYFTLEWQYEKFSLDERLTAVGKEMAARQENLFRRTINDAGIACEEALAQQFIELLSHQIELLTPTGETNKDGSEKRRTYRDSALSKLNEFVETLPFRNLTANPELEGCRTAVKDQLAGLQAEMIRTDGNLRAALLTEFTRVKGDLEKVKNSYGDRSRQVWNKITEESKVFRVVDQMDGGAAI